MPRMTSCQSASHSRGKRNVRSAEPMRRSCRQLPGLRAERAGAAHEKALGVAAVVEEIFARDRACRRERRSRRARRTGRSARSRRSADRSRCSRSADASMPLPPATVTKMRSPCVAGAVPLHRRLGRRKRRPEIGKVDALLRARAALDRNPHRGRRHVESHAGDRDGIDGALIATGSGQRGHRT